MPTTTPTIDLVKLNELFSTLTPAQRIIRLYEYFQPEKVLFTSSFGAQSVFMLHLMKRFRPGQKVHFINTGYLFRETHEYRTVLTRLLSLEVIELQPDPNQNGFTRFDQTWENDPDLCCTINKVLPLEDVKPDFDVWISGLRRSQSESRAHHQFFEQADGIIKFYPVLDQSPKKVGQYIHRFRLPLHPLVGFGYASIGCSHCTVVGCGRKGRWKGRSKTECGLHTQTERKAS